jgi:hypothetical protein
MFLIKSVSGIAFKQQGQGTKQTGLHLLFSISCPVYGKGLPGSNSNMRLGQYIVLSFSPPIAKSGVPLYHVKQKGVMYMKIERISDSQIRCTLSNIDLIERNLKISELAYGNEKARRLFREMIQKASAEVGFETEDLPLMVEAIPLSNESVVLLITKVDDPEEMDPRFSRFAPSAEAEFSESGDMPDLGLESSEPPVSPRDRETESPASSRVRIFVFGSLDQVIDAAKAVGSKGSAAQTLYKHPSKQHYYLILKEDTALPEDFSALCNRLSEYGSRSSHNESGVSYLEEHYELILKENALTSLAGI